MLLLTVLLCYTHTALYRVLKNVWAWPKKHAIKYAKHVAAAYLAAPLMFITNMLNKQITHTFPLYHPRFPLPQHLNCP